MEEGKLPPGTSNGGDGSGGGGGESSRPLSSYVKVGDRQMFNVELRPDETTIVSWKKLIQDANKVCGSNSVPDPPVNVRPSLEARIAPLAQLWPSNTTDNHGIKLAIIRPKKRGGAMHSRNKDQERIKRKKVLTPRQEGPIRGEPSSVGQQQRQMREKGTLESGNLGLLSANKAAPNITNAGVRVPNSSKSATIDRLTPEKIKERLGRHGEDTRVVDGTLIKKKVKRKPELDMNRSLLRPEKLPAQGEERRRPPKQAAGLPVKSNLQLQPSSVEQSS